MIDLILFQTCFLNILCGLYNIYTSSSVFKNKKLKGRIMYILNFNSIFTNEETNICIQRQPTVIMSSQEPFHTESRDLEGKKMGNRIIAIQFSIEYDNPQGQHFSDTHNHFDLSNIKVQLKRFIKKTNNKERYSKLKHKSRVFTLPQGENETFGFKTDIGDLFHKRGKCKSSTGCQLISIYSDSNGEEIPKTALLVVFDNFKRIFGIQYHKDTEKYGYQFTVEIGRFDDKPSVFISSDLFKVILHDCPIGVNFNSVDLNDYHLNQ